MRRRGVQLVEDAPVVTNINLLMRSNPASFEEHHDRTQTDQQDKAMSKERGRSCLSIPKPPSFLLLRRKKPEDEDKWEGDLYGENERGHRYSCGLPPRASSSASSEHPSNLRGMSPREEADELKRMLRMSLKTSDELRKRLCMLSRYYEDLLQRLHNDRQNMETDLVRQISMTERRLSEVQAELAVEKCYRRQLE